MNSERRWWPQSPFDLIDVSKCPACFAALASPQCTNCGLNLAVPEAARLFELGKSIVATEDSRQQVIDGMRQAAAEAATQAASAQLAAQTSAQAAPPPAGHLAPPPAPPLGTPVGPAAPLTSSAQVSPPPQATPQPAQAAPTPAAPARERRKSRLTVPTLLIIVGVFLASVAAIGLAWYYSNLLVRAGIIALFTVATILAATALRKRSLTMSAEGVAVLGVVLLGLDAWAVYATNLFGAGGTDPLLYAGIAVIVVGLVSRVWAVLSELRAPDFAAVLSIPAGLGMLIASIGNFDPMGALTAGLLGASFGTLIYRLPAPYSVANEAAITERTTLAGIGVGTLAAGILSGFWALADSAWAPLWITLIMLAIAVAHLWAMRPAGKVHGEGMLAAIVGVSATFAVATLGWQLALRLDGEFATIFPGPVIATSTFVAITYLHQHPKTAALSRAPLHAATAIAGFSVLIGLFTWLAEGIARSFEWQLWQTAPFAMRHPELVLIPALTALVLTALLFAVRSRGLAWVRIARPLVIAPLLLAGGFASGAPGAVVVAAALIGACAVGLMRVEKTRSWVSVAWLTVSAIAGLIAFFIGMTHPGLWLGAVTLAIALPIGYAWATRAQQPARNFFALAPVAVATLASMIAPGALAAVTGLSSGGILTTMLLLQWIALVTLAASLLLQSVGKALQTAGLALLAVGLIPLLFALIGAYWTPGAFSVLSVFDAPWLSALRAGLTLAVLLTIVLASGQVQKLREVTAGFVAPVTVSLAVVVMGMLVPGSTATTLLRGSDWEVLTAAHVGVLVASVAALVSITGMLHSRLNRSTIRTATDIGALLVAIPATLTTALPAAWASLVALAVLFAAMSASRGWQNPVPADARPSLRRLLIWASTLSLGWAWVSGISQHARNSPDELYIIPVAALFAVLCVALVWLRRHVEAAVAIVLATLSGLGLLASTHWGDRAAALTLVVIAMVAATLAVALHWLPTRSLPAVATAGATAALASLVAAVVGLRIIEEPYSAWWLLLLVGAAYAAGIGAAWRAGGRRLFAQFAPPASLGAASLIALTYYFHNTILIGVIAGLGAIHLASAYLSRTPFALASRVTSGVLVVFYSLVYFQSQAATPPEWPTLAVATIGLGGVALALVRRTRSGMPSDHPAHVRGEVWVWVGALALALLPSISAEENSLRTWLVVALGGFLALAAGLVRHPLALPTSLTLAAGSLLMGTRALVGGDEITALVAGGLAVGTAVVLTISRADAVWAILATSIFGTLLAGAATVALTDGELMPTVIAVAAVTLVGIVAALGLKTTAWWTLSTVVTVAAAAAAIALSLSRQAVAVAGHIAVEAFVWPLVATAAVVLIALVALLASKDDAVRIGAGVALSVASLMLMLSEIAALPLQDATGAKWAALLTVTVLSVIAVTGFVLRKSVWVALWIIAAVAAGIFSLVAFAAHGVRPAELLTGPIAVGLSVAGLSVLWQNPAARSWPALGAGLVALTVPSLLYDFGENELWRVVALGVVSVGLIVWGAVGKLQAPLVVGSVVTAIHGIAQLWPWIRALYTATEWWLWAGVAGVLLIVLAIRYEKQKVALRKTFDAITSLR